MNKNFSYEMTIAEYLQDEANCKEFMDVVHQIIEETDIAGHETSRDADEDMQRFLDELNAEIEEQERFRKQVPDSAFLALMDIMKDDCISPEKAVKSLIEAMQALCPEYLYSGEKSMEVPGMVCNQDEEDRVNWVLEVFVDAAIKIWGIDDCPLERESFCVDRIRISRLEGSDIPNVETFAHTKSYYMNYKRTHGALETARKLSTAVKEWPEESMFAAVLARDTAWIEDNLDQIDGCISGAGWDESEKISPLFLACLVDDFEMADLLLSKGATIKLWNVDLLEVAVDAFLLSLLVLYGVDVNMPFSNGKENMVRKAAKIGDARLMRLVLGHGGKADCLFEASPSKTPMGIAVKRRDYNLVAALACGGFSYSDEALLEYMRNHITPYELEHEYRTAFREECKAFCCPMSVYDRFVCRTHPTNGLPSRSPEMD